MARYRFSIAVTLLFAIVLMAPASVFAKDAHKLSPVLNQGRQWRIGYYEGGSYVNYPANLRTIVTGLVELGWMAPIDIPPMDDATASKPVWDYLAQHAQSEYIEFVSDGYWSAQWFDESRKINQANCIGRLNREKDIDFMIAMGTWAGQDLSNSRHFTPTMAVSVSDPVRSGISETALDSGLDHFHAKCDPNRYIRQLRLFHRLVKFKRLGVVYENTPEGKTYAAFDDIQSVSRERGFEIITCEVPFSEIDRREATNRLIECHYDMAQKVDAVFVTVHRGMDTKRMDEITAPFLTHKIPTWSQRGPQEVQKGVLFSISRGGFRAVGRYHAEVMAAVFNGQPPRSINQIFEDPKLIAVNTKTAESIGFEIPNSILRIADEIYEGTEE
ncbi:MAG: ABC transporter substrate-binding protein [Desulfobacteraceae bacterium]